ncbi:tetratricopeptide repeat protein [Synechocystis sp. PCC 7509]|uniref:tetratricopeptide repeat protein n=1 Tax=Synechocystis sp. PCC 7509 TaxID=927677 RepID=UPI0002AC9ABC|nr:tetratricopeptide repeat protein [Synechocystis sp. PCC 7509]
MSDISLGSRYNSLIDRIVQTTLKGQISSKEQVYQLLRQEVELGTGELFERSLSQQIQTAEQQNSQTDELKQAKAMRSLRALKTIQGEWERVQKDLAVSSTLNAGLETIIAAQKDEALGALLKLIDPNRNPALTLSQIQQLAKSLQQTDREEFNQLAQGLTSGIASWQQLQEYLISWMYDNREPLGFVGVPGQKGPWSVWAKQTNSPLMRSLFNTLALQQPIDEWISKQNDISLSAWVELAVTMQCLQQGLVAWFNKQAYNAKAGANLAFSTFLTFASIWSQLANGLQKSSISSNYLDSCFQITLQILRTFAQTKDFPLYGGIFALLSGDRLRFTLSYFDEPLRQVEGTQEKARILTLLGYSLQALGQIEPAKAFAQQAMEIAQTQGDIPCEIANLNHLSRACVTQKDYQSAINYSQRALILARQSGEKLGEANALTNLGYSQVFQAQQLQSELEVYESAIQYLQQGLELSQRLGDLQSQALCCSSLGVAYLVLSQPQSAIPFLEQALQSARISGDLYLQGQNFASLASAYYSTQNIEMAMTAGSLGMYLLEQIGSEQWRQSAGLLTILQGQIGEVAFQAMLKQCKAQIIQVIGVDGYDYLSELLKQYQNSL